MFEPLEPVVELPLDQAIRRIAVYMGGNTTSGRIRLVFWSLAVALVFLRLDLVV